MVVFKTYLRDRGAKTALVKELSLIQRAATCLLIVLVFLITRSLIHTIQYPNQVKWPFKQHNIISKKKSRKYRVMVGNLQLFTANGVSSVLQDFKAIHEMSEKRD